MNERVTQISLPDSAQAYLLHHLPNKREKMDSLSDLAYKAYQTHKYLQMKNQAMIIKSSTHEYGEGESPSKSSSSKSISSSSSTSDPSAAATGPLCERENGHFNYSLFIN